MADVQEGDQGAGREDMEEEEGEDSSEEGSEDGSDEGSEHAPADLAGDTTQQPSSISSRRSRAPSPTESLVEHTACLKLTTPIPTSNNISQESEDSEGESEDDEAPTPRRDNLKDRVASDITRHQARQAKYHSKRGARKVGRPKGSKAKQDTRVKQDTSGFWD